MKCVTKLDYKETFDRPLPKNFKLGVETCDYCKYSFEYEDDGKTFACLPDGIVVDGGWYCTDCIYCENCGESLEDQDCMAKKEKYRLCDDCVDKKRRNRNDCTILAFR